MPVKYSSHEKCDMKKNLNMYDITKSYLTPIYVSTFMSLYGPKSLRKRNQFQYFTRNGLRNICLKNKKSKRLLKYIFEKILLCQDWTWKDINGTEHRTWNLSDHRESHVVKKSIAPRIQSHFQNANGCWNLVIF